MQWWLLATAALCCRPAAGNQHNTDTNLSRVLISEAWRPHFLSQREGQGAGQGSVAGQYEDLPYPTLTRPQWARERAWYLRRTSCHHGQCRIEQEQRDKQGTANYGLELDLLNHYLYRVLGHKPGTA